jgi:hypothetical protein
MGPNAWAADEAERSGAWGDYWLLAEAPNAGDDDCATT